MIRIRPFKNSEVNILVSINSKLTNQLLFLERKLTFVRIGDPVTEITVTGSETAK